jgi:hypothetical protein
MKEVIYMYGSEFSSFSLWWICPVVLLAMCFFSDEKAKRLCDVRIWFPKQRKELLPHKDDRLPNV